jgi:PKD repeat protein
MVRFKKLTAAAVMALTAGAAGCTVHKQETPDLTGPSGLAKSITVTVNPDTLAQDGQSQSLVSIEARDTSGQPLRSLALRTDVAVGGSITTALGSLSASSVVTDANGRASVVYTAPSLPAGAPVPAGTIQIIVTPSEGDAGNATARSVNIRLVMPPGTGGGPASPFKPDFAVPAVSVGDSAAFSATVVDSAGNDVSAQISTFLWNFDDGSIASGRNVTHAFHAAGNFGVTLTITDFAGRTAQAFHSVTVGAGTNPTATIVASPASPNIGQPVTFTATNVVVQPGHRVTNYAWDFGDGGSGSGTSTSHAFTQQGSFTVVLTLTDDAGRVGTATQSVSVGQGNTTAVFTFSPNAPLASQTINFNASQSLAAPGRTIVSYSWDFGDGTTGSGVQTTHAYSVPASYTVTLTVRDSAGQTAFATQTITIQNDAPTARFTVTPGAPSAPTGTDTAVLLDATSSTAASGRTIVAYNWTVTGTGPHSDPPGGATQSLILRAPGVYSITLTVTDNAGKTSSATQNITVTGT